MFSARYALSPYIKQTRLVFKGLIYVTFSLIWEITNKSELCNFFPLVFLLMFRPEILVSLSRLTQYKSK